MGTLLPWNATKHRSARTFSTIYRPFTYTLAAIKTLFSLFPGLGIGHDSQHNVFTFTSILGKEIIQFFVVFLFFFCSGCYYFFIKHILIITILGGLFGKNPREEDYEYHGNDILSDLNNSLPNVLHRGNPIK